MVEIYAQDRYVKIASLDRNGLPDAARIYNCGDDTRYATGYEGKCPMEELTSLYDRIKASDNEFIAGIYIKVPGNAAETMLIFTGLCSGLLHADILWIRQLSFLPEHRRKGIGTRTVAILSEYAKMVHGVREICLSVAEKNTAGLCFWRKLGFTEAHRIRKELFGEKPSLNVIIMQKNLF